jgi:hypothetical protein
MSTAIAHRSRPGRPLAHSRTLERGEGQWAWLLGGLVLAFALPFLFADLLTINRDLYYGIYAVGVFGFFALWLRYAVNDPAALLRRNWRWGLVLGIVFACATAAIAFTEKGTSHPSGLSFIGAIVWRGIVYGAADGVLLSVFPILAVVTAFGSRPLRERRRRAIVGIGALALATSLLFTAVYHVGYRDFRGEKLRKPLIGDIVWSVPTLATLSPIGAPLAHIGLHVSAVVHAYDTNTFLPPHGGTNN